MSFRVVVPRAVEEAIDAQVSYLIKQGTADDRLQDWLDGLLHLIDSLSDWPRRFPVADATSAARGYEVRRANRGDYAIFFRVDDEHRFVEILAFRHGRQQPSFEREKG
ncbi:MAG: type II toxin-antitoxin system RelE/ParE family toxin [Phycisphaeraceae bacterium]|nr:type II toxin-antitoxin system RelE/ParE family toxin [Phycisphaeraceae bacterium]